MQQTNISYDIMVYTTAIPSLWPQRSIKDMRDVIALFIKYTDGCLFIKDWNDRERKYIKYSTDCIKEMNKCFSVSER